MFFLPFARNICLGLFSLAFLASGALAQSTVSVIGPVTPGDCAAFNSTTIIKDAGVTCGGGGGGSPGGSNGQVQFNNAGSFGGLTNVQLTALVQQFSSTLSGSVPASGGGNINFLRADGTFAPVVIGPAGATSGHLPSFNGTSGNILQDSGIAASDVDTLSGNQSISGAKTFNGNATFNGGTEQFNGVNQNAGPTYFGGNPWFDVKSTANSCAGAVGNNIADDTTAIQCHINYMHATYGGGTVFFPPSAACYLVSSGGLVIPGGVWLVGSSIDSTCIDVAANGAVLNAYTSAGTCPGGGLNGGIDKLSIYGYQNAAASTAAIIVGANCVFNIYNSRVWFGSFALNTAGFDGTVFNSFLCGYSGCIQSTGANWYVRVKLDAVSPGTIPTTYGFAQGVNTVLAENHLDGVDMSCGCTQSILVSDGHNNSITRIISSIFDSPIVLTNQKDVMIVAGEVGSTSFTLSAGTLLMSSTAAFGTTTISGAGGKACATNSNTGFTNC